MKTEAVSPIQTFRSIRVFSSLAAIALTAGLFGCSNMDV